MAEPVPAGFRGFFESLPELFRNANRRQWEFYEETLYTMRRPVTHGNYYSVARFAGAANAPPNALKDTRVHHELNGVLSEARYPDAAPITALDSFAKGSTEFASALLHFNNPAYPIYDAASIGGLQRLGFRDIRYVPTLEEDSVKEYQGYVDAIQKLKDAAPFWSVPEKNYYLTRIVQEGLWMMGLEQPATPASDRPRPTRR